MTLEEFECTADKFDGETAHITLKKGYETIYGEYPVSELVAAGIRERRRFKCRVVEEGGLLSLELESIPDKEIDEDAINKHIEEALGND